MYPCVTCPECGSDLLCFHDEENATCACGNEFNYRKNKQKKPEKKAFPPPYYQGGLEFHIYPKHS